MAEDHSTSHFPRLSFLTLLTVRKVMAARGSRALLSIRSPRCDVNRFLAKLDSRHGVCHLQTTNPLNVKQTGELFHDEFLGRQQFVDSRDRVTNMSAAICRPSSVRRVKGIAQRHAEADEESTRSESSVNAQQKICTLYWIE